MVVVSDAGLDVEARITYAHEYTHALQDAAFGPDALDTDTPGDDDGDLARLSMIEGDAPLTMLAWMLQNLSQAGDPRVLRQRGAAGHDGHPILDGRPARSSRTTPG